MPTFVYDIESLPNRTLFCALDVDSGARWHIWRHEPDSPEKLRAFAEQPDVTMIGFNSNSYDKHMVAGWVSGMDSGALKALSDDIITNRLSPWAVPKKYKFNWAVRDHIDLIEVAPSFVGLKAYGARMHMKHLQDNPLKHDAEVQTAEQEADLLSYCWNDVETTAELLKRLEPELLLRVQMSRQYGVDMRSKSDAQMAEQMYISSMGLRRKENPIPRSVTYPPPAFLRYEDPQLTQILQRVARETFYVNPLTGHVVLPDFLGKEQIRFGAGTYQLGVGGIHSTHDSQICHLAGDSHLMCDIDAASFYPSIILEHGFVPSGLGRPFVDEYRAIYTRRLAAKKAKDKVTDATLKIALNGTFGKLASRYSVLYAPDLMLAVTLTGQLTLLMLIEWLEAAGAEALSANTDGIAIKYRKELDPVIQETVERFSQVSRFSFEFTPYRALAMKDVNNYFAVKPDRSLKVKGIYSPLTLKKNPTAQVSADAVGQWLAHGTPIEQTVRAAPFVDFLSARSVTGGGEQSGRYLGKVVRWYQSTDRALPPIVYASNGNKVPKTDGARECMTLPDDPHHPADLDYDWYVLEAYKIAAAVGCEAYLSAEQRARLTPPPKSRKKVKDE